MKKTSDAQLRANKKYSEKFERINTRLPLGTKEQIEKTGAKSVNTFIIDAVNEKLEHETEKIERVTIRLKNGTTERIKAVSNKSINGFITEAIENQIAYNELEQKIKQ